MKVSVAVVEGCN